MCSPRAAAGSSPVSLRNNNLPRGEDLRQVLARRRSSTRRPVYSTGRFDTPMFRTMAAVARALTHRYPGFHMRGFALCAVILLSASGTALANPPETYPLAKVHRGQTGYGMTTFAGDTPERFTFEVVSVVHNFLPKQDIVLVKSDDPKMAVTGFWRGMSGSPLYIDDKLLCAFSYGFAFNKIALGGCTPIEYMKRDGLDSYRRMSPTQAHGGTGPGI